MELNQTVFAETLEQLKETARLTLIHDYLRKNHIGIDEPGNPEENLSNDDVNFLEMYLAELSELPPVSDGEKRAVMMSALAGDSTAQSKLLEIYLPQVVEISKLYAGRGALVEDLIGEGNGVCRNFVVVVLNVIRVR